MPLLKKTESSRRSLTPADVKEIAEDVVREAVEAQARDLEKHLRNIHDRLVALETRR